MRVGQKVVCIKSSTSRWVIKGRIYTVENMVKCECGHIMIAVGVVRLKMYTSCSTCGMLYSPNIWFNSANFAPIQYNSAHSELVQKAVTIEKSDIPIKEPQKEKA